LIINIAGAGMATRTVASSQFRCHFRKIPFTFLEWQQTVAKCPLVQIARQA
jgi:hypothetical protein